MEKKPPYKVIVSDRVRQMPSKIDTYNDVHKIKYGFGLVIRTRSIIVLKAINR